MSKTKTKEQVQEVVPEEEKVETKVEKSENNDNSAKNNTLQDSEEWTSAEDYAEQMMSEKPEIKGNEFADMEEEAERVGQEIEAMATEEDAEQMTPSDLYSVSLALIELVDGVNSGFARYVAKAKTSEEFEIPENKRKKIAKALAFALYKSQAKLGPWTTVIILAVLYFGTSWKNALSKRKENILAEKKQKLLQKKQTEQNQNKFDINILGIIASHKDGRTRKQLIAETGKPVSAIQKSLKRLLETNKIKQMRPAKHTDPIIYKIA